MPSVGKKLADTRQNFTGLELTARSSCDARRGCGHGVEQAGIPLQRGVNGEPWLRCRRVELRIVHHDDHDAVGVSKRQRSKQNRVDYAEKRRHKLAYAGSDDYTARAVADPCNAQHGHPKSLLFSGRLSCVYASQLSGPKT